MALKEVMAPCLLSLQYIIFYCDESKSGGWLHWRATSCKFTGWLLRASCVSMALAVGVGGLHSSGSLPRILRWVLQRGYRLDHVCERHERSGRFHSSIYGENKEGNHSFAYGVRRALYV